MLTPCPCLHYIRLALMPICMPGRHVAPIACPRAGLPSRYGNSLSALALFVRSLRATGSTAEVVVFGPEMHVGGRLQAVQQQLLQALQLGGMGAALCGVRFVSYEPDQVLTDFEQGLGIEVPPAAMLTTAVMASFLQRVSQASPYNGVMVAPLSTLFQRDPFANVYRKAGGGLTMFIASPVHLQDQPACLSGLLRIHEKAADVVTNLVVGGQADVAAFLRLSLSRPSKLRRCSFRELIMLNVWRKVRQSIAILYAIIGHVLFSLCN